LLLQRLCPLLLFQLSPPHRLILIKPLLRTWLLMTRLPSAMQ